MSFRRPEIMESACIIIMEKISYENLMNYEKNGKIVFYEVKGECIMIRTVMELLSLTICFVIYYLNRCQCDYCRS